MKISINGKEGEIPDGSSITALLAEEKVSMPEMVTVELNGNILGRDQFDSTQLSEGDKVEFLYFMGGGH